MSTASANQLQSQIEAIRLIDKKIDSVRLELYRRYGRFNTFNAHEWQLAWDCNPDLFNRSKALFDLRMVAIDARDAIINREYSSAQRRARAQRRAA